MSLACPGSGPQVHAATAEPAEIKVVAVALEYGCNTIAMPLANVLMPVTTTLMLPGYAEPLPDVWIDLTYLETFVAAAAALDSQPQNPAFGRVVADWALSVMLVRQAEAARIASDILARAV